MTDETEMDRLWSSLAAMQQELEESRETQALLQAQVIDAGVTLTEFRKREQSNKSEIRSWKERCQDLEKTMPNPESEQILELRKIVGDYARTIGEYKRKLTEVEAKSEDALVESRAQIESLKNEIAAWQTRYQTEIWDENMVSGGVVELKSQIESLKTEAESREKNLHLVRQLALKYKAQAQDKESKIVNLEHEIKNWKSDVKALEERKKELKDSLEKKRSELEAKEKTIHDMRDDRKKLEKSLDSVKQELREERKKSEKREELLKIYKTQIGHTNSAHMASSAENRRLKAELNEYWAEKAKWEKQLLELKASSLSVGPNAVVSQPANEKAGRQESYRVENNPRSPLQSSGMRAAAKKRQSCLDSSSCDPKRPKEEPKTS